MTYYRTCPYCEAHLDPGESCDCQIGAALLLTEGAAEQWAPAKSQTIGNLDKKTAHAAANNVDGRAEQTLTRPDSASMITQSQGGLQDEMDR